MRQLVYITLLLVGITISGVFAQAIYGTFTYNQTAFQTGADEVANQPTDADYLRLRRVVQALGAANGYADDWYPTLVIEPTPMLQAYARGSEMGITTGLLRLLNDEELAFVMGHELTHVKEEHLETTILTKVLILLCILFNSLIAVGAVFAIFFPDIRKGYCGLLWLFLTLTAGAHYGDSRLGIRKEWAADRGAVALTHNPAAGASAFEKMRKNRGGPRAELLPGHRLVLTLFPSHPETQARIDALRAQ